MAFEPSNLAGRAASRYGAHSWKRVFVLSTMKSFACVLGCLIFASLFTHAQGVGTSGEITGTVTDSSGGLVLKATVSVVDAQTGLRRTATTNNSGQYRAAGLPPATYDVSVEMAGFATQIRKAVTVSVGQTAISDFKLNLSKVATIIEVTG